MTVSLLLDVAVSGFPRLFRKTSGLAINLQFARVKHDLSIDGEPTACFLVLSAAYQVIHQLEQQAAHFGLVGATR